MKFASVLFNEESGLSWGKRFISKLPEAVIDRYVKKKGLFITEELDIEGVCGYRLKLPFSSDEAEKEYEVCKKLYGSIIRSLGENGVTSLAPPEDSILSDETIFSVSGRSAFAAYVFPIIEEALKREKTELSSAETVIIDGGSILTEFIMEELAGELNFLSVYTASPRRFDNICERICLDTGLNAEVFSNSKNANMRNADIIINASFDMENYDYELKNGAIYIDIMKNSSKLKRLMKKRGDMVFLTSPVFLHRKKRYTAAEAEAAAAAYYEEDFENIYRKNEKEYIDIVKNRLNSWGFLASLI